MDNAFLLIMFCLLLSCKETTQKERVESNDELIAKYCDIEIDKIAVVTTQDTNRIKRGAGYGCILGLKLFYSITNNGKKPFYLEFNDLSDEKLYDLVGVIPGHKNFKFYVYPFLFKEVGIKYLRHIVPGSTRKGNITTPILDVLIDDRIPKTEKWLSEVDSIRIYLKSPTDTLFKKELGRKNMKKEHLKVQFTCWDIPNYYEL